MASSARRAGLSGELRRGAIVVGIASKDDGKPRPALVVQSDLFNPSHPSVVLCPITSHLIDAGLFRIPIEGRGAGLSAPSQIMVDKITAVPRDKIGQIIGGATEDTLLRVNEALRLWLDLAARH